MQVDELKLFIFCSCFCSFLFFFTCSVKMQCAVFYHTLSPQRNAESPHHCTPCYWKHGTSWGVHLSHCTTENCMSFTVQFIRYSAMIVANLVHFLPLTTVNVMRHEKVVAFLKLCYNHHFTQHLPPLLCRPTALLSITSGALCLLTG